MAGPRTAGGRRRGDVEYALYMLVSGMCSLAIYWAARNAARRPGTPVKGPFAYREPPAPPPEAVEAKPVVTLPPRRPGEWRGV